MRGDDAKPLKDLFEADIQAVRSKSDRLISGN